MGVLADIKYEEIYPYHLRYKALPTFNLTLKGCQLDTF